MPPPSPALDKKLTPGGAWLVELIFPQKLLPHLPDPSEPKAKDEPDQYHSRRPHDPSSQLRSGNDVWQVLPKHCTAKRCSGAVAMLAAVLDMARTSLRLFWPTAISCDGVLFLTVFC